MVKIIRVTTVTSQRVTEYKNGQKQICKVNKVKKIVEQEVESDFELESVANSVGGFGFKTSEEKPEYFEGNLREPEELRVSFDQEQPDESLRGDALQEEKTQAKLIQNSEDLGEIKINSQQSASEGSFGLETSKVNIPAQLCSELSSLGFGLDQIAQETVEEALLREESALQAFAPLEILAPLNQPELLSSELAQATSVASVKPLDVPTLEVPAEASRVDLGCSGLGALAGSRGETLPKSLHRGSGTDSELSGRPHEEAFTAPQFKASAVAELLQASQPLEQVPAVPLQEQSFDGLAYLVSSGLQQDQVESLKSIGTSEKVISLLGKRKVSEEQQKDLEQIEEESKEEKKPKNDMKAFRERQDKRIKNNEEVDDELMDFYYTYLRKLFKTAASEGLKPDQTVSRKDVPEEGFFDVYMSSFFAQQCLMSPTGYIFKKHLDKIKHEDCRFIFVPLCMDGHWSLIVIRKLTWICYIFDSIKYAEPEEGKEEESASWKVSRMQHSVLEAIETTFRANGIDCDDFQVNRKCESIYQKDNFSCGYHVMAMTMMIRYYGSPAFKQCRLPMSDEDFMNQFRFKYLRNVFRDQNKLHFNQEWCNQTQVEADCSSLEYFGNGFKRRGAAEFVKYASGKVVSAEERVESELVQQAIIEIEDDDEDEVEEVEAPLTQAGVVHVPTVPPTKPKNKSRGPATLSKKAILANEKRVAALHTKFAKEDAERVKRQLFMGEPNERQKAARERERVVREAKRAQLIEEAMKGPIKKQKNKGLNANVSVPVRYNENDPYERDLAAEEERKYSAEPEIKGTRFMIMPNKHDLNPANDVDEHDYDSEDVDEFMEEVEDIDDKLYGLDRENKEIKEGLKQILSGTSAPQQQD